MKISCVTVIGLMFGAAACEPEQAQVEESVSGLDVFAYGSPHFDCNLNHVSERLATCQVGREAVQGKIVKWHPLMMLTKVQGRPTVLMNPKYQDPELYHFQSNDRHKNVFMELALATDTEIPRTTESRAAVYAFGMPKSAIRYADSNRGRDTADTEGVCDALRLGPDEDCCLFLNSQGMGTLHAQATCHPRRGEAYFATVYNRIPTRVAALIHTPAEMGLRGGSSSFAIIENPKQMVRDYEMDEMEVSFDWRRVEAMRSLIHATGRRITQPDIFTSIPNAVRATDVVVQLRDGSQGDLASLADSSAAGTSDLAPDSIGLEPASSALGTCTLTSRKDPSHSICRGGFTEEQCYGTRGVTRMGLQPSFDPNPGACSVPYDHTAGNAIPGMGACILKHKDTGDFICRTMQQQKCWDAPGIADGHEGEFKEGVRCGHKSIGLPEYRHSK